MLIFAVFVKKRFNQNKQNNNKTTLNPAKFDSLLSICTNRMMMNYPQILLHVRTKSGLVNWKSHIIKVVDQSFL